MGDKTRHVNHTKSVYVTKSLWTTEWVRLRPKISQINKKLWDEVCGYLFLYERHNYLIIVQLI